MFTHIAAFTGGLIKDTVVGVSNVAEWVVDEVSSIPDAFSSGYEHGLITGPETEADHHVDVEELSIAEKHAGLKFGQHKAA